MSRVVLQGALYSFCLPDGSYGGVFPGSHIQTYRERVELPGEDILFLDGTRFQGRICMAGQGHSSGFAWLYADGKWRHLVQTALNTHETFGVNPCRFDGGKLYIATSGYSYDVLDLATGEVESHMAQIGTQGIRYVENGVPVSGDATYTAPGAQLHEYTVRGDVTAGQGHESGLLVNGRVLEPGLCYFVRFERSGDALAIATVKLQDRQAVLHWLTVAEIASLPNLGTTEPDPVPVPPVHPPEPTHMEDQSAFVANHPMKAVLGKGATEMERAYNAFRFVCAVARDLGPLWGVQKKDAGDFLPRVNGQGYWGDGLRTRTGGVDIVNSREGTDAAPSWNNPKDDADPNTFAAPPSDAEIVAAMGGAPVVVPPTPVPVPVPTPTPVPVDVSAQLTAIESRLAKLEAWTRGV
jgi:hypothetical protein